MADSVIVDGIKYVREVETLKDYSIIRSKSAGVFAGNVVKVDGQTVEMKNARRLWYWDGAASLSQLAMEGVKNPDACKFPCEVPAITVMEVIEIIPCTETGMNSIKKVAIWKR